MKLKTPFDIFIKKLNRKNESRTVFSDLDEFEEEVPMSTTDKVTSIIDTAISNGRFGEMNERMRELSDSLDERESFIFAPRKNLLDYVYVILLLVATLGCVATVRKAVLLFSYTNYYDSYATGITGIMALFMICNILLIIWIFKNHSFTKRFPQYIEWLSRKNIEFVDDVAGYTGIPCKQVTRDLKRAVAYGLIPQGHLVFNNRIIFTSDTSFKMYLTNRSNFNYYFMKELQRRDSRSNRDPEVEKIIQEGALHVQNIRNLNNIIKDAGITQKLDHMENIVTSIFYEVDNNPSYADELGLLLDKYLPMIDKLLNQYINLSKAVVPGYSLKHSQSQIEGTLDTLNQVFEKMLNQFYQEQERSLMESVLSIEDIVKAEEELKGVSVNELMRKYS